MGIIKLTTPLSDETLRNLHAGDMAAITGVLFTARDAAHKLLVDLARRGLPMPFDFQGQIVYYAGPCPSRPGHIIGSVGPTTSGRMDSYAETLIPIGLKAMIGKGARNQAVKDAITACNGVYFAAIGGAGALLAQHVTGAELVAFPELGAEAVYRLTVEDFPVVVACDAHGHDVYLGVFGK